MGASSSFRSGNGLPFLLSARLQAGATVHAQSLFVLLAATPKACDVIHCLNADSAGELKVCTQTTLTFAVWSHSDCNIWMYTCTGTHQCKEKATDINT